MIAKADDWKYGYNKRGLLAKAENPVSIPYKITYSYDKKMRLAKFKSASKTPYARESSGTFAYDRKGRLVEIVSNGLRMARFPMPTDGASGLRPRASTVL